MTDSIATSVRRQYILGKQGLWPGRRWAGKEGTAEALRTAEAVQVDPVFITAQSHDIVLWGRVCGYQSEYLNRLLYAERRFFDYGNALMIYPIEELPYWRVMMERRRAGERWSNFSQENAVLLNAVRREIRARGPLRSRNMDGGSVEHYRSSKDSGVALYYLWLVGELMIHSRQGKERIYDFLENVAPRDLQWTASEEDAIRYFTRKSISHLGLVSERDFYNICKGLFERPVDAREAQLKLAEMVESGQLGVVGLEGRKELFYYLASDAHILEDLSAGRSPQDWQPLATSTTDEVVFLSPLEYVSARGRARDVFAFDYSWEIYKPAVQRKYGPYTMPVLYGDRLVARLDARLDQRRQKLLINGFWLEEWFDPDDAFASAFARGWLTFAGFLGVKDWDITALNPSFLRARIDECINGRGLDHELAI